MYVYVYLVYITYNTIRAALSGVRLFERIGRAVEMGFMRKGSPYNTCAESLMTFNFKTVE